VTALLAKPLLTPEDLLSIPDGDDFELVDGRLVERHMGWKSSWIGSTLLQLLKAFAEAHRLGWVSGPEAGYQCFRDRPNLVRKPDVSFLRRGRLPREEFPEGHCRLVPDVAAEVVSPKDTYYEVESKVREYLDVGVPLVWVVNPATKSVRVHRPNGTVTDLREAEELSGEDVVPGFRCRVGDLFPPPAPGSNGATEPTPSGE
jgi:Uma2 family endonuclease